MAKYSVCINTHIYLTVDCDEDDPIEIENKAWEQLDEKGWAEFDVQLWDNAEMGPDYYEEEEE